MSSNMSLLNSGTRNLGQNPTPLGSDWQHKQMYDEYVQLWHHFNSIGLPEVADQMTLQMEQQYSVPGGTQPMLNSFKDISTGGTGGYSQADYDLLTGGVNPVDGSYTPTSGAPNVSGAQTAGTIAGGVTDAAKTIADPKKDGVQKALGAGSGALGTLGALGVGGMAVPILGAAAGIGGLIYDYNKNQNAEIEMDKQLRNQAQIRDIAAAKYNRELDNDYARRELGFRGQTQASPLYTAAMANAGKNYANQQQTNTDMLQKGGMSGKSGMLAQMASQNYGDMAKAVGKATKDSLTNQQRAYGGLANLATSTSPEMNKYNMAQGQYNDTQNFGSNVAPLANMAGAYAKSKFRDAGMESMYNDYEKNKAGV